MGTLIILNILINIIKFSKIIDYTVIIVTVAYLIINLIIFILNKNKLNKKEKINNLEKIKIEKEIEILEENIKNTEKEINEIKNPKAEHYIKAKNKSKEELIFIFSNLSYNFKSSVNGGNAWIGQQEILEAYYQYINN